MIELDGDRLGISLHVSDVLPHNQHLHFVESRKAALHALIEEIVVYPDVIIEVKSWLIWPDGCWYYGRW